MPTSLNGPRGDFLRPTDRRLVTAPLNFLVEEHLRHRQICAFLVANAQADKPDFETMALSLAFLRHEFLLHDADERASLYPLMRQRCEAEDEIEALIQQLTKEHEHARQIAHGICDILERGLEGTEPFSDEDRRQMMSFADKVKRYITLENAIILPLARARLTDDDMRKISKAMLMRRGVVT